MLLSATMVLERVIVDEKLKSYFFKYWAFCKSIELVIFYVILAKAGIQKLLFLKNTGFPGQPAVGAYQQKALKRAAGEWQVRDICKSLT